LKICVLPSSSTVVYCLVKMTYYVIIHLGRASNNSNNYQWSVSHKMDRACQSSYSNVWCICHNIWEENVCCSPIYAQHEIYVYDINTNHWDHLLPSSNHCFGVPHSTGGKLAIISGRLFATKQRTNRVYTFDENSQTWISHYPDILSVRNRPGVATHLEHVIVNGGVKGNDTPEVQDEIEILNWVENSHWRKISVNPPEPMWAFTPSVYRTSITVITRPGDHQGSDTTTKWITMTTANQWHTAGSSPPFMVGGCDQNGSMLTAEIKMYDYSSKSCWRECS